MLGLLAQLILRCAENPPSLAKLGEERQPVNHVRVCDRLCCRETGLIQSVCYLKVIVHLNVELALR